MFSLFRRARSRRRPAPGVRPRRPQTGQLANGERAREHARESQVSGLAPQPPAYLVPSPAFPLSSYRSGRDRIADCNRVYIAAGPPQSTVLSPRQARVDRAPDSRVLRPSESLKVDSRRARSNTFPHRHTDTHRHTGSPHRTGSGRRDSQGRASGRPCSLTSHDTRQVQTPPRPFTKTKARTARWTAA